MDVIIKENLEYLAKKTVNFEMILNLLAQEEVLNFEEWNTLLNLEKSYYDKVSILYCDYITKKCPLQTLLKCLEESSNKEIATKFQLPHFLTLGTASENFTDFVVKDEHKNFISKILNEEIDQDIWEEVKTLWLSQKMRNDVGRKSSMKLDILESLKVWICGTAKEERLYSKIVKRFEEYPKVKEKLLQNSWRGLS